MSRLIHRGTLYFTPRWRVIPFSPILYFFIFGAAIRLWTSPAEPPPFEKAIGPGTYGVWLAMGVVSPVLALIAFLMVEFKSGIWRYQGIWIRLGADIGVLSVLLTYHISVMAYVPPTEVRMFSRYMVASVLLFMVGIIVRDIWSLVATERAARGRHQ